MPTRQPQPQRAAAQVSVILPTYNRAGWLAEAVDSVLGQEYAAFELIVVDDGSSDETPQVLAAYGDRLRVLRLENGGVSRARNRGVAVSRGELLAFLDSDDLWQPGKLAAQVAFMEAHPEIAICQTEEIWIRNGRRVNPRRRHRKSDGMFFERSLELCLVSPSAVMMRRSLFEAFGGFDETLPACEDYDLWLRIGCRHPVGLIDAPLVVKRGGHADQLSRMPGLDRYRIRAIAKLLAAGVLDPGQQAAAVAVLRAKCHIYAAGCRKRGRRQEARFYEALAANPF
ncbi:MAG TPA: glycosyltransferase [Desulfobacteraceae bacterium]|nr:glycosyltransferase [Deltaproteobacteria bacterium]MBW2356672.1 glycosyltransferase [Deltaproteobacteria bacterium]HDI58775.1 glycosyltransferase [Desulfobacteraceae bacterium]